MDRVGSAFEMRTNGNRSAEGLAPSSLIRIFVPSADRFGRPLDLRSLLQHVVDHVLTFTSGVTISKGVGIWRRPDGILLRERVRVVDSYVHLGMDAPTYGRFLSGLSGIALAADQEEWLVVVDGAPILLAGLNALDASGSAHGSVLRNGGRQ